MKTKYIKVPVSEEPNEMAVFTVVYEDLSMTQAFFDFDYGFVSEFESMDGITHYLKEVPDHSEEMLSVLSEVMRFKHELRMIMSDKLQYPDNFLKALNDAEQLINKVKDNETVV
ncbi:hypothetical protein CMU85_18165 [Elizabethkingia anophelis]|nr:hypothetical protein [Elizabethkingia anophelis]